MEGLLLHRAPPQPPPPNQRAAAPQWQPGGAHEYAVPTPWLGAYYTLREGDETAIKKRERLCGRRSPSRGRFIVNTLDRTEVARIEAEEPWRKGLFKTADFVEVEHRASLSDPVERVVGLVIGRSRKGLGSSFNLLCELDGVAVEYKFMLYSPLLLSLDVRGKLDKQPKTRKIYYMRDRLKDVSIPAPRVTERKQVRTGGKKGKKR